MRIQVTLKVDDEHLDAIVTALKEFGDAEDGVTDLVVRKIKPQTAVVI
jgi:hypothetical protein